MNVAQILETLDTFKPATPTAKSLTNPHSYRGFYDEVAFELSAAPSTVGDTLAVVASVIDRQFEGWKGGEFTMGLWTRCWIAIEGAPGREFDVAALEELVPSPRAGSELDGGER